MIKVPLSTIIFLLSIHWLADFVCQTDYQAKNKSTNNLVLLGHVTQYTVLLYMGCALAFATGLWTIGPVEAVLYSIANGCLHFATDYTTSRITKRLWEKGDIHNFFVVIGFDQLVHYTCLFGTLTYLQQ